MLSNSPKTPQAVTAVIRQRMLAMIRAQKEKAVPRVTVVKAVAGAGCSRWYSI